MESGRGGKRRRKGKPQKALYHMSAGNRKTNIVKRMKIMKQRRN